jgi:hypothetical protein
LTKGKRIQVLTIPRRVPVPARAAVVRRADALGLEVMFFSEQTKVLGTEEVMAKINAEQSLQKRLGIG